ncbi:MAG TPA: exodeoxyribonuclease VII small subunit [Planctomycetota bacterium]|nr:exodeoxyribonuclease VII small subunit [Planctomycetota bacterium]
MGKRPPFEKSLEALEEIVAELESGQLTLDEALDRYERGVAIHKACTEMLAAAEKRIEVLLKGSDGELTTSPLKADEEPPREDES